MELASGVESRLHAPLTRPVNGRVLLRATLSIKGRDGAKPSTIQLRYESLYPFRNTERGQTALFIGARGPARARAQKGRFGWISAQVLERFWL